MTGTSNNGGEDSAGSIISGETGLAHAGAIVNDESGCVFVTHLGEVRFPEKELETVTNNFGLGSDEVATLRFLL